MMNQKRFDQTGNSWEHWVLVGRDLLKAASVIEGGYDWQTIPEGKTPRAADLLRPLLMLRGMALECFLKAIYVHKGNILAEDGKLKRIPGSKGHNLCLLAKTVGFKLSSEEQNVVERLAAFITFGRYPIETDWEKSKGKVGKYWGTPDVSLLEAVLVRIEDCLGHRVRHTP